MKVAIIGSRGLILNDFSKFLPPETTEIVTGGARGIDTCAEKYAKQNGIYVKVFLLQYKKCDKSAAFSI